MNSDGTVSKKNDPLYFYEFTGKEMLFDFVYTPSITPIMKRASLAGCKVCNGLKMLEYQTKMQFDIFTGKNIEKNK
jgi:3-dehydroquinate dehydratase/shikimate dehydrogenase